MKIIPFDYLEGTCLDNNLDGHKTKDKIQPCNTKNSIALAYTNETFEIIHPNRFILKHIVLLGN